MKFGGGKRFAPGRRLLAVLLVLAGVLSFTQTASAAKLNLVASSGAPSAMTASRCSGNTLTIAITGTVAAVSGIAASACSGRTLRVYVRSASATITASGTISGATANLTLPSAVTAADGATATIDTWSVPVSWSVVVPSVPAFSCVIPSSPSVPCTVTVTQTETWGSAGNRVWQKKILISTTSTQPVAWRLTVNVSDASHGFLANRVHDTTNGGLVLQNTSGCSATPRTVTVTGNVGWGYSQISASSPREVQVRGDEVGGGGNLLNC